MAEVYRCGVTDCKYNEDNECTADYIEIDEILTGSGFQTYDEHRRVCDPMGLSGM